MREIGFLSRDGASVSRACKETGESTHPMKERAIVIFELVEKEEREKKVRAEVMERIDRRDGEPVRCFQAPTKWVIHEQRTQHRTICNKNKKGYPTLVSSFNAYNKQKLKTRYQM